MTTSSGFGRDARLKDGEEFRKVFRQGRKTSGRFMVLWHLVDPTGASPKLGLSVSRKVGGAVRRNRLKRLLRESFRLRRPGLPPGLRLVASPRSGCPWRGRADAEAELSELLRRSGAAS